MLLTSSLCQNNPFMDGNKRVAFIAARSFLRRYGLDLDVGTLEATQFMLSVASGDQSVEKVADWIARHLCEFEPTP